MNRALFFRCGAMFLIIVLLLIPLARINGLVRERQAARDMVVQDIARSAAGPQTLTGPLLVVPYTRTLHETQLDSARMPVTVTREVTGELRLLPALVELDGKLATDERRRGIYRARVFDATARLTGRFDVPARFGIAAADEIGRASCRERV